MSRQVLKPAHALAAAHPTALPPCPLDTAEIKQTRGNRRGRGNCNTSARAPVKREAGEGGGAKAVRTCQCRLFDSIGPHIACMRDSFALSPSYSVNEADVVFCPSYYTSLRGN